MWIHPHTHTHTQIQNNKHGKSELSTNASAESSFQSNPGVWALNFNWILTDDKLADSYTKPILSSTKYALVLPTPMPFQFSILFCLEYCASTHNLHLPSCTNHNITCFGLLVGACSLSFQTNQCVQVKLTLNYNRVDWRRHVGSLYTSRKPKRLNCSDEFDEWRRGHRDRIVPNDSNLARKMKTKQIECEVVELVTTNRRFIWKFNQT